MVSIENWDEGCNAKFKAYQKLREEKDKMFEENKVFKKFRGIWRGLKRCHKRATQPNKLTEYEIPTDTKKYNKIIADFDPAILFEEEYAKDEAKDRAEEIQLYGPVTEENQNYKEDKTVVKQFKKPDALTDFKNQLKTQIKTESEIQNLNSKDGMSETSYQEQLKEVQITSDQHENIRKLHEERDNRIFARNIKEEKERVARL